MKRVQEVPLRASSRSSSGAMEKCQGGWTRAVLVRRETKMLRNVVSSAGTAAGSTMTPPWMQTETPWSLKCWEVPSWGSSQIFQRTSKDTSGRNHGLCMHMCSPCSRQPTVKIEFAGQRLAATLRWSSDPKSLGLYVALLQKKKSCLSPLMRFCLQLCHLQLWNMLLVCLRARGQERIRHICTKSYSKRSWMVMLWRTCCDMVCIAICTYKMYICIQVCLNRQNFFIKQNFMRLSYL